MQQLSITTCVKNRIYKDPNNAYTNTPVESESLIAEFNTKNTSSYGIAIEICKYSLAALPENATIKSIALTGIAYYHTASNPNAINSDKKAWIFPAPAVLETDTAAEIFEKINTALSTASQNDTLYEFENLAPNMTQTIYISINETSASLVSTLLDNGLCFCNEQTSGNYELMWGITGLSIYYTYPSEPSVVHITSPTSDTFALNDVAQTIAWSYSNTLEYAQTHYDLQASYNGGASWVTLANKTASSTHSCTIAANTLNTGDVLLRVRAYHTNGTIASGWSQIALKVKGTPSTSVITCNTKPRLTLTWTASQNQQAIQVVVTGIYDSGVVFTSGGTFTVPEYLADGVCEVKFRYADTTGAWSNWSLAYPNIANTSSGEIELTVTTYDNAFVLAWAATANTFTSFYILRDGVCIGKTTNRDFIDKLACGLHTYKIRGTLGTDYYTDSGAATATNQISRTIMRTLDAAITLHLKRVLNAQESKQHNLSSDVSFEFYSGRSYPVAVTGGNITRTSTYKYVLRTKNDRATLESLIGKTVAIFDDKGYRQIGVLTSAAETVTDKFCEVSLSVTDVDYPEVVAYDD